MEVAQLKIARCLILAGSIVLFVNGLAHLIGYSHVTPILVKSGLPPAIASAIKALWLTYTIHLVLLSIIIVWISRLPRTRPLLFFLALFPLTDALLMFRFIGPFIGLYGVSVAALLLLIGAWLLPHRDTPAV